MFRNFIFLISIFSCSAGFCDPNITPQQDRQQTDQDVQTNELDEFYSQYELVLSKYVDENGLVNYPKLRRYRLELIPQVLEFSTLLQDVYNDWPRQEKKCFWINAYNFYALKSVIDNYPINPPFYKKIWWPESSVVHIDGFYDKNYVVVMGLEYTLDELEQIAVNDFNDPNVCFAITNATLGAPPLAGEPYRAGNFDAIIDSQIKKHLARDVGFEIDTEEQTLVLAEMFDKHSDVFIQNYGDMKKFRAFDAKTQAALNFIDNHGPKEIIEDIQNIDTDYDISFKRRNWRYYMNLNETGIR